MRTDSLFELLYTELKNQGLWFVTKEDDNWLVKPKKYYTLNDYGEIKDTNKVEKEINDYLGDGAETILDAIKLFITDGLSDGSIACNCNLTTVFKDKPVDYSENAVEVKNIEPKYIEPQITGSNKQVESKQLNEIVSKVSGTKLEKKPAIQYEELTLDDIEGSMSEEVAALYYQLGIDIDETWENVQNDMEYGYLKLATINDKTYIVYDDGETQAYCSGRDNNNIPLVFIENIEDLVKDKKQEDIFDDVTNGKATYGVYDDTDIRNIKDRYKEPINAKRNKIRNFKDSKFDNGSVRDIINKGVTHVSYEKMPNERIQAYKNSKKEENVQRRLEEENNKSANTISDMFQSKDFDSESKMGRIVMRTSNLFNVLSDKGYDVQVSFDNGESTNVVLLGQQGGQVNITIDNDNQPLRAYANGSFEITEDNMKILNDVRKEIETI